MSQKIVTWEQFQKHIYSHDCWVLIEGNVYNVNDYLVEHPGGDDILVKFSGRDGTSTFLNVPHTDYAVSLRNARLVGKIETPEPPQGYLDRIAQKKRKSNAQAKEIIKRTDKIKKSELTLHRSEQSCWIVLNGKVLDVTSYLQDHPGGVNKIMEYAGEDGSKAFRQANHSLDALKISQKYIIGQIEKSSNSAWIVLLIIIIAIGAFFALK